jgi:hypothetical protein
LDAPQSELYPEPRMEALMVLFRIVSRESWDKLQSLHKSFSGSRVEHVLYGICVLIILPGGARELAS